MANSRRRVLKLKVDKFLSDAITEALPYREPDFRKAAGDFVRGEFRQFGGVIESSSVTSNEIEVTWLQDLDAPDPLDEIVAMLEHGKLAPAAVLMELLLSDSPNDSAILYKLGMAYSDLNMLETAVNRLTRLLKIEPDHVNGQVAMGVALLRQGRNARALEQLQRAVALDPSNPWAQRTSAGACSRWGGRMRQLST